MISRKDVEKEFLSDDYQYHNTKRLLHLASLGLPIRGKSVLEVGAGIGCHTQFFIDRDCRVVSTEVRDENLTILRERYPGIDVRKLNLDDTFSYRERFDIVYCYGTLYHLSEPTLAIRNMSLHCRELLLLETCVSFSLSYGVNLCPEDKEGVSQSFLGKGCRPSRQWVYDSLKKYFEFVYLPITQPVHQEFPIDWIKKPTTNYLTRAIFIGSRVELKNKLLVSEIPMRQRNE